LRSAGIVEASRFAPLLGTLSEEAAGARPALDFLHPRRRPAQKSRTERARPLALAAGAVFAGAAVFFYWQLAGLDTQIREKRLALTAAKQEAEKFDKIRLQHKALETWQDSDIVWLDELASISRQATPPQAVMFTGLTFDTTGAKGTPQAKIDVLARSIEDIQAIGNRLRSQGVEVAGGKQGKDNRFANYPDKYEATLTIKPLDPKTQLARLTAPLPAALEIKAPAPPLASPPAQAADTKAEPAKTDPAAPAPASTAPTPAASPATAPVAASVETSKDAAALAPAAAAPGEARVFQAVPSAGGYGAPAPTINAAPAGTSPAAPVAQPVTEGAVAPTKGS
jgi:hypothetical protein